MITCHFAHCYTLDQGAMTDMSSHERQDRRTLLSGSNRTFAPVLMLRSAINVEPCRPDGKGPSAHLDAEDADIVQLHGMLRPSFLLSAFKATPTTIAAKHLQNDTLVCSNVPDKRRVDRNRDHSGSNAASAICRNVNCISVSLAMQGETVRLTSSCTECNFRKPARHRTSRSRPEVPHVAVRACK
ncbi:unnamed protein product [Phytophthora lilii]|uniref:Unnamed protein product n=1 Tax=Phytophthora lilii TaxID=2077276 RepID=A0A9W6X3L3_9STRA|nr:unnamed protein product [Phytophthora lilii]